MEKEITNLEELEELEEKLVQDFAEKEEKKAMQVHSASLRNIHNQKSEGNDSNKKR